MKNQIIEQALANGRSMNSEILIRLRNSFPAVKVHKRIIEPK